MNSLDNLKNELSQLANSKTKKTLEYFFKTGPGEYAEGDIFLGITVPEIRKTAKDYYSLSFHDIKKLFLSKIHEHRFIALVILRENFKKGDKKSKKEIFDFYLANINNINNWDLVDVSAPKIIGAYLNDRDRKILYKLARSKNIWERRIAIVSTFTFIRNNDFFDTLTISELLLNDSEDLLHKACGWMLRELGKRDEKVLKQFLDKFGNKMPRTMLRYAIEKFSKIERKKYLKK